MFDTFDKLVSNWTVFDMEFVKKGSQANDVLGEMKNWSQIKTWKMKRIFCFRSRNFPTQVLLFFARNLSRAEKSRFRRSQSWDPGWPHGRFLKDFLGVLESTDSRWANPIDPAGGKPWEVSPIMPQTLAIFSLYLVIENGGILNWFLHEIKIQIFQIKTVIFKNILTHGHWLKSVIKVARFWEVAPINDVRARQFFRQCELQED